MDLDVSMRSRSCNYTVHFFGAMFREVSDYLAVFLNGPDDCLYLFIDVWL